MVAQLQTGLLEMVCSIAFATAKLGDLKNTLQLEMEHFPNWPSRGFAMSGVKEARL